MGWGRGWIGWAAACACLALSGCGSWTLRSGGTAATPSTAPASYTWEREGRFPAPAPVAAAPAGATATAANAADLPTHEIAPTAGLVNTDASFSVESLPARSAAPETASKSLPALSAAPEIASTSGTTAGFRVQVFASRSQEAAATMRDELAARFSAPVQLDFEPPYYKVRIGACENEASCRQLVDELRSAGFAAAFTVPARIAAP